MGFGRAGGGLEPTDGHVGSVCTQSSSSFSGVPVGPRCEVTNNAWE